MSSRMSRSSRTSSRTSGDYPLTTAEAVLDKMDAQKVVLEAEKMESDDGSVRKTVVEATVVENDGTIIERKIETKDVVVEAEHHHAAAPSTGSYFRGYGFMEALAYTLFFIAAGVTTWVVVGLTDASKREAVKARSYSWAQDAVFMGTLFTVALLILTFVSWWTTRNLPNNGFRTAIYAVYAVQVILLVVAACVLYINLNYTAAWMLALTVFALSIVQFGLLYYVGQYPGVGYLGLFLYLLYFIWVVAMLYNTWTISQA